jgi:valyl-tRNA synthetase
VNSNPSLISDEHIINNSVLMDIHRRLESRNTDTPREEAIQEVENIYTRVSVHILSKMRRLQASGDIKQARASADTSTNGGENGR